MLEVVVKRNATEDAYDLILSVSSAGRPQVLSRMGRLVFCLTEADA